MITHCYGVDDKVSSLGLRCGYLLKNTIFLICYSLSPSSRPLILPRREFRSSNAGGRTMLAGVGGVESNFMMLTTPAITTYDHPDLPAILVYIECLCALEVRTVTYTHAVFNGIILLPCAHVQGVKQSVLSVCLSVCRLSLSPQELPDLDIGI